MQITLSIAKAIKRALEYYEKELGLTDTMQYVLWDMDDFIRENEKSEIDVKKG
jgi:hypothetical protein